MKKTTAAIFLAFTFCLIFSGFAQDATTPDRPFPRRTLFKFSPLHLLDKSLLVGVETFIGGGFRKSIAILPVFYYVENSEKTEKGFAVELQYRAYPLGFKQYKPDASIKRARGLYFAPSVAAGSSTMKFLKSNNSFISLPFPFQDNRNHEAGTYECKWVMPSLLLGFQFTVWEVMYMDINIGGGLKINDVKVTDKNGSNPNYSENTDRTIFDRDYKGFLPRASLTFGMAL